MFTIILHYTPGILLTCTSFRTLTVGLNLFMPPQAIHGGGYYVFRVSRCPVSTSPFLSLRTNTERISMKFAGGNHHQLMNWLHFGRNYCTRIRPKIRVDVKQVLPRSEYGGIMGPRAVFSSLTVYCEKPVRDESKNHKIESLSSASFVDVVRVINSYEVPAPPHSTKKLWSPNIPRSTL